MGKKKTYDQIRFEYIKASEKIRCDINKESDPVRLLDLSLLCISLMTGDSVFYKQNRDKLRLVIGKCNSNR